jgi:hypothetical protein
MNESTVEPCNSALRAEPAGRQEITQSDYVLIRAAAKDLFNKSFADIDVTVSSKSEAKRDALQKAVIVFKEVMKATPTPGEQSSMAGAAKGGITSGMACSVCYGTGRDVAGKRCPFDCSPAASLTLADSAIIGRQVAIWRKEVERLNDLIAHAAPVPARTTKAESGEAFGYVNVKYGTYFGAAQFAATERNTELLNSGEVVRVFSHPPVESERALADKDRDMGLLKLTVEQLQRRLIIANAHITDLEASERARARGEDERKFGALHEACLRACGELPEGFEVRIELENGCGCVVWTDPVGNTTDIEGEGYLSDDVNEAIDAAILAATREGNKP